MSASAGIIGVRRLLPVCTLTLVALLTGGRMMGRPSGGEAHCSTGCAE